MYRKEEIYRNKSSEKDYRDVVLNLDGGNSDNTNIVVHSNVISQGLMKFCFPVEISQSTIGGREGSNACTIIAVVFGSYCSSHRLDLLLLWQQLPQVSSNAFVNAICEDNRIYDDLYSDTAVCLEVEDVVNAAGNECRVSATGQALYVTDSNNYDALTDYVEQSVTSSNRYGVIIRCGKSVGVYVKQSGLCLELTVTVLLSAVGVLLFCQILS